MEYKAFMPMSSNTFILVFYQSFTNQGSFKRNLLFPHDDQYKAKVISLVFYMNGKGKHKWEKQSL